MLLVLSKKYRRYPIFRYYAFDTFQKVSTVPYISALFQKVSTVSYILVLSQKVSTVSYISVLSQKVSEMLCTTGTFLKKNHRCSIFSVLIESIESPDT